MHYANYKINMSVLPGKTRNYKLLQSTNMEKQKEMKTIVTNGLKLFDFVFLMLN